MLSFPSRSERRGMDKFSAELKRRHIYRVAAAYANLSRLLTSARDGWNSARTNRSEAI